MQQNDSSFTKFCHPLNNKFRKLLFKNVICNWCEMPTVVFSSEGALIAIVPYDYPAQQQRHSLFEILAFMPIYTDFEH